MVRKKTGITSRLRISKVEDRDLTVESHDSGRNERFFETSANVIEDVARLGIVGTVQSDIAIGNKLLQFFESRSVIYRNDFNLGVYGFQRDFCAFGFIHT